MRITARRESWPIAGAFRIARGAKTQAEIVLAEIEQDGVVGRGECVPYARYGESVDGVLHSIRLLGQSFTPINRQELQSALPPGAARNALDCALWDLEAKANRKTVWQIAGLPVPQPAKTSFTISLDTPDKMEDAARSAQHWPLLKVKLDGNHLHERLAAIHRGAPRSEIIIDANESWSLQQLGSLMASPPANVVLIEQPLTAGHDEALKDLEATIPLCADESAHDAKSLNALAGKYQAINIKLDKTGGLTEALSMAKQAQEMNLQIMVGCMVGTSLSMAPAMMLSSFADFVDLDGPLLLARDRRPPLQYADGMIFPPSTALWG